MDIEAWTGPLPEESLRALELREWQETENEAFAGLLNEYHYLGCPDARKMHLRQVVLYEALLDQLTCDLAVAETGIPLGHLHDFCLKQLLLVRHRPENVTQRAAVQSQPATGTPPGTRQRLLNLHSHVTSAFWAQSFFQGARQCFRFEHLVGQQLIPSTGD
jgi:hypothetical protein